MELLAIMLHPQEQAAQAVDPRPQAVQEQRQPLRAVVLEHRLLLTVRAVRTHSRLQAHL